jgi:hypothetical protein
MVSKVSLGLKSLD